MSPRTRPSRAALWLYAIALLAYPGEWRSRFGRDHRDVTVARWRAASARSHPARAALVLFDLLDICWSGLLTRIGKAHGRRPRHEQHDGSSRMDRLWRHLRHGARSLGHARGFTILTAMTLAVGIGSATAAFTAQRGSSR